MAPGRVHDAFVQQFGPADPTRWRVFRSDSTSFEEVLPTDTAATNGTGCWLRTRRKPLFLWTAGCWTSPVSSSVPIALKPGWNSVGNPYGFDIAWSQVRKQSNLDSLAVYGPYAFDGAGKSWSIPDTATVWKAWSGAVMLNSSGRKITFNVPGIAFVPASARVAGVGASGFRIGLRGWQRSDDTARLWMGIASAMDVAPRNLTHPLPPVPGRELVMAIPAARAGGAPLFADTRPPSDSGARWTIDVSGLRADTPLTIDLAKTGSDTTTQVWILDVKSSRWLEYEPRMSFAVGSETTRQFMILAGAAPQSILDLSKFGIASRSHGISWRIPQDMGRTRVRIDFYDIEGKILLRLVDEEMDPGAYSRDFSMPFPTQRSIAVLRAGGRQMTLGTMQMR
jgi:hypothetical protein